MREKLDEVFELNRTVQPSMAQSLLIEIITIASISELHANLSSVENAINDFFPKRQRLLRATLEARLLAADEQPAPHVPESPSPTDPHIVPASPFLLKNRASTSNRQLVKFTDITFGLKSAEAERRVNPSLLIQGFLERNGVIEALIHQAEFLVLGYKGSGKSSIAEHISLEAESRHDLFAENLLLKDFPYEQVPEIVSREGDLSLRTNLAWSILLLLKSFESLTRDEAVTFQDGGDRFNSLSRDLRELGLIPKRKFRDLVLASRELNLSVELPKILRGAVTGQYREPTIVLSHIRDALKQLIRDAVTPNKHVITIDGLDEVFTSFDSWYGTIASLVHEVDSLNADFAEFNCATKIVLLCRTDIYERLPSPNINKLRDFAVLLDWYHNPQRPHESDLFAVAQHRAELSGYQGVDVIRESLPNQLYTGRQNFRSVSTYKFLLDHTRHTPRDFLQLLHHIQKVTSGRRAVSESHVIEGLRQYSIDYFLPELKDELAGYFDPPEVDACFRIIGGLRQREFSFEKLKRYAEVSGLNTEIDLEEAIRVLFDCSAVGNIVKRPRYEGEGIYYTFRYRNRNASVNYNELLVLHRGVWKALNIV